MTSAPKDGSRATTVVAGAVLLVAAMLIFARLDARLLWVDEAETALLGRSIQNHGLPLAIDGNTVISQEVGRDFDPVTHVWKWTPWLEKYLAAGSFTLFGRSTFSARLPFALAGLLAVAAMYPLGLALFRDRWTAVLSMAMLALSVPFLLHVRQCRYYSLVILGSIGAIYFVAGLVRGRKGAVAGLVVSMTVLFHSNFLTFVGMSIAMVPFALLCRERPFLRQALVAGLALAVVNGPWLIYFDLLGRSEQRIGSIALHLRNYLELTNRYTFPSAALVVFLGAAWLLRRRIRLLDVDSWRPFVGLLLLAAVYLVFVSTAPWYFYRYSINLLPLLALVGAFMCRRLLAWNRAAGAAFSVALLLTGVFHTASALPPPRLTSERYRRGQSFPFYDSWFPMGNYLHELTHDFNGPLESVLDHLRRFGKPGDRVFISYGDLVLKFYTDYEVRGGQTGQALAGWDPPEWIVVRAFFRFSDRPHLKDDSDTMLAWLKTDVPWKRYREVVFPVPDFPWDNIPEPNRHWYIPPGADLKPVQVFHKVAAR